MLVSRFSKYFTVLLCLLFSTIIFSATTSAKVAPPPEAILTSPITSNSMATNNPAPTLNPTTPTLNAPLAQPIAATPAVPVLDAKGYILMDANSGAILAQSNANTRMYPASLTKLMSMYVISGALRSGQIHMTDPVTISKTAWSTGGSRMFIKVGSQVPVQELINGIVVASGNDATMAMAEYVGGNIPAFVDLMNKTAARLGMSNTHFVDPTGLPDPNHYSTPYDLALLTRHIINDYPEDYKLYDQKWIIFNNIKQPNRNRLLWRDPSVDGLKTGHTSEAGFCLIASAKRNGTRLIAVVMGTPSDSARNDDAQALLNYGFRVFEGHKLYSANTALANARIWLGQNKTTPMGLAQDLYITIPAGQYKYLKADLTLVPSLQAPISKGNTYGKLNISLNGKSIVSVPVIALTDNSLASFWNRVSDRISLFFSRWF